MHSPTLTDSVADIATLLESIAFVAVEHEASLDVTRLADLVDLYAHHLKTTGAVAAKPFEDFVRDASLLDAAAASAAAESGIDTSAPAPLFSTPTTYAVRDCRTLPQAATIRNHDAANDATVQVA